MHDQALSLITEWRRQLRKCRGPNRRTILLRRRSFLQLNNWRDRVQTQSVRIKKAKARNLINLYSKQNWEKMNWARIVARGMLFLTTLKQLNLRLLRILTAAVSLDSDNRLLLLGSVAPPLIKKALRKK